MINRDIQCEFGVVTNGDEFYSAVVYHSVCALVGSCMGLCR